MSSYSHIKPVGLASHLLKVIEAPTCKNTKILFNYWTSICGENRYPLRKDFNPVAITSVLPYVFMLDILEGGNDFKIRLLGTMVVEVLGKDFTGKILSEISNGINDKRLDLYKSIAKAAKPYFLQATAGKEGGVNHRLESAYLPLLNKEGEFKIILCGFDFLKKPSTI